MNCVISMFGFMKLYKVDIVVWFLDTTKQLTFHLYSIKSVVNSECLLIFSKCLVSICFSKLTGTDGCLKWMLQVFELTHIVVVGLTHLRELVSWQNIVNRELFVHSVKI